jgi:hypothetical protein
MYQTDVPVSMAKMIMSRHVRHIFIPTHFYCPPDLFPPADFPATNSTASTPIFETWVTDAVHPSTDLYGITMLYDFLIPFHLVTIFSSATSTTSHAIIQRSPKRNEKMMTHLPELKARFGTPIITQ